LPLGESMFILGLKLLLQITLEFDILNKQQRHQMKGNNTSDIRIQQTY
jgi:hypothetical protein